MIRCRRSGQVATVSQDGRCYVASLDGDVVVLQDNAVIVWDCVAGPGGGYSEVADIISRVAARVGLETEDVADETRAFLDSLCESGLLIAE